MHSVVHDDIDSPYTIFHKQTCMIFFIKLWGFYIPLLTPHGGHHGACCVTSYGLHLSATPLLRAHMTS